MAVTPYSTIYNAFLNKITDTDFLLLSDNNRKALLLSYLNYACGEFSDVCTKDLNNRDDDAEIFNIELSLAEIDIITDGMLVAWITPKYLFNENMHNVLNTKDFNMYSPANLLKEIRETYNNVKQTFERKMIKYSYLNSNFEDETS